MVETSVTSLSRRFQGGCTSQGASGWLIAGTIQTLGGQKILCDVRAGGVSNYAKTQRLPCTYDSVPPATLFS